MNDTASQTFFFVITFEAVCVTTGLKAAQMAPLTFYLDRDEPIVLTFETEQITL